MTSVSEMQVLPNARRNVNAFYVSMLVNGLVLNFELLLGLWE